ncbi:hypothetical protein [Mucilaginibacter ginsenosidivorax]|nr:hypothetical protein [Mucilaginibacter ginsenosidivorax]
MPDKFIRKVIVLIAVKTQTTFDPRVGTIFCHLANCPEKISSIPF